jgi:hypothetical protein
MEYIKRMVHPVLYPFFRGLQAQFGKKSKVDKIVVFLTKLCYPNGMTWEIWTVFPAANAPEAHRLASGEGVSHEKIQ